MSGCGCGCGAEGSRRGDTGYRAIGLLPGRPCQLASRRQRPLVTSHGTGAQSICPLVWLGSETRTSGREEKRRRSGVSTSLLQKRIGTKVPPLRRAAQLAQPASKLGCTRRFAGVAPVSAAVRLDSLRPAFNVLLCCIVTWAARKDHGSGPSPRMGSPSTCEIGFAQISPIACQLPRAKSNEGAYILCVCMDARRVHSGA